MCAHVVCVNVCFKRCMRVQAHLFCVSTAFVDLSTRVRDTYSRCSCILSELSFFLACFLSFELFSCGAHALALFALRWGLSAIETQSNRRRRRL